MKKTVPIDMSTGSNAVKDKRVEAALRGLTKIHDATATISNSASGGIMVTLFVQGAAHALRVVGGGAGTVTRVKKGAGAPEIVKIYTTCVPASCTINAADTF